MTFESDIKTLPAALLKKQREIRQRTLARVENEKCSMCHGEIDKSSDVLFIIDNIAYHLKCFADFFWEGDRVIPIDPVTEYTLKPEKFNELRMMMYLWNILPTGCPHKWAFLWRCIEVTFLYRDALHVALMNSSSG